MPPPTTGERVEMIAGERVWKTLKHELKNFSVDMQPMWDILRLPALGPVRVTVASGGIRDSLNFLS